MPNRHRVPEYNGMLDRPRMRALVEKGLRQPLLVLLAGPGYGKSQSVASYLASSDAKMLWLRLNRMDNLPAHFWTRLVHALEQEFPAIAEKLQGLEFPATPSEIDAFAQILTEGFEPFGSVIWVLDDFGEITDPDIRDFIRILLEMNLEALHVVVMSNTFAGTESIAFMVSNPALILERDLRFTSEEIADLYDMNGIRLEKDALEAIERYTEGWPLALHLLSMHHEESEALQQYDGQLTHHAISALFDERFFADYAAPQKKLLVKLSLLDSFTQDFARELYEGDAADIENLPRHEFVKSDPIVSGLFFHNLYRQFLQSKKYLLSDEEQRQFWKKAADFYSAQGHLVEAIACYRECGDHIRMLEVVTSSVIAQFGTTQQNAAFLQEHIGLLTPEELRQNPLADVIRALILLNMYRLEEAEALLLDLEQRLLLDNNERPLSSLGEVYVMLGFIHMLCAQEDFYTYFEKAVDYLPDGSALSGRNKLRLHNNHCFNMMDNRPGARERMEDSMQKGVHWASVVLRGGMSGMDHLFSAEAALLSYQLEDARQHAYRAIYKAESYEQHDLVCNSSLVLARVALLQGNFAEMERHIQAVTDYAEKYNIGALKEIRDTALAWYYIKLHDYKQLPKSMLSSTLMDRPIMTLGRVQIVYANYLFNMGEYAQMLGMLEQHHTLHATEGISHDYIYLHVLLAMGYYRIGNHEVALKALWAAYDMTYNNGLITPFIETEKEIRTLINLAREQQTYVFDPAWLDLVEKEAGNYAKKAATTRAVYRKHHPEAAAIKNPLTKREMEILTALSQGLTREEIAGIQYVSVNTVKTFIRSIYNKLNVSNRAEAISIAIARGYIDISVPNLY